MSQLAIDTAEGADFWGAEKIFLLTKVSVSDVPVFLPPLSIQWYLAWQWGWLGDWLAGAVMGSDQWQSTPKLHLPAGQSESREEAKCRQVDRYH